MIRRTLALAILLSALVVPLVAQTQPAGKVHRIGMLMTRSRAEAPPAYRGLLQELENFGYREGQNTVIEWRYTEGKAERMRDEAAALVRSKPDVVVAATGSDALAMRETSTSVPIVVAYGGDLVRMGLANSLARPGGNVTGLQILQPETAGKRFQLIRELVPRLTKLAVLHRRLAEPPRELVNYSDEVFATLEALAQPLSVRILRFPVVSAADFEATFAEMAASRVEAVMVLASPLTDANRIQLGKLAVSHRLPTIHEFASAVGGGGGGLVSYGANVQALFRRAAWYVDRILKGAKAGDLPIEQATKLELVINLKTATALGLTIPQSVLVRADRVIQ